ncbi:MAG: serine/threonine protein kinase [Lachnospiraceae bacterium]|nr:serine/threonine protein kinase [Lachnospiraceae bacterium]
MKIVLANRYRVIRKLGTGGMGSVYLARDERLGKLWAIKELGDSGEFADYTRRSEVSVLRKVSHPNLPRITDIFDENKKTYMVMDYIEGKTLKEILAAAKKIPPRKFYRWSLEITSALIYLHSMNPPVIYRDLKPSNIIIRPSGDAVLIDFGTAKKLDGEKDEFAFGTKRYAAPEQYEGISDKRSDIYSLGKVLSDMSGSDATLFLKRIIKKCVRNEPSKRYRNADSVRRALIISRDIYKYALILTIVIILAAAGVYRSGINARDSVRQIEELNESERINTNYDNALMCFYELKDYPAARSYFEKVDEERIPESSYYIRLCDVLLNPAGKREDMFDVVAEFEEFNEDEVQRTDEARKAKNDLRIAGIYLSFADGDKERLKKAYRILEDPGPFDEQSGQSRLLMLEAVCRELGRTGEKKKWFLSAIACNDELIGMDETGEDPEFLTRRYLNNARFYEELSMFKKADECYRECKERFPLVNRDIYTGHLRLLLSKNAPKEMTDEAYREALLVRGIETDREFIKLKERMGK